MAVDTVPAAVPGPDDPAGTPTTSRPEPGLLTSMLAAVEPARPAAFNLDPTTVAGAPDQAVAGVSSAAYHPDGNTPESKATNSGNGRQNQSIWRAWLLAGAERWKKGAGANIKRLELKKAKAQANQVKEARTVTVNRADGGLSGKSSGGKAGGGAGKSLGSKTTSGGSKGPKGPKNTSGGRGGSSGRSGSGGASGTLGGRGKGGAQPHGTGGGKSSGGTSSTGSKSHGITGPRSAKDHGNGLDPKPSPTTRTKDSSRGSSSGAASGSGKALPKGSSGSDGKTAPGGGSSTGGKSGGTDTGAKKPGATKTDKTPSSDGSSTKGTSGKRDDKVSLEKKPKEKPGPKTGDDRPTEADTKGKGPAGKPTTAPTTPGASGGKPFSTRESREAGYRDGTRAAKAVAHAKAYRDGVKDGYGDTTEAADRDKARLDKAHADRKQARDKEQPVTGTGNSADYHKPEPIQVKDIDATHLSLGYGADRERISRGEVRSLKQFERRLEAKTDAMTKVAEDTKGLKEHAEEQAKKATQLLEIARAVKGGEKLIAALARHQEAAAEQAGKAEEIHKRALRAAEACKVLLSNVETRYGGMYKAVVDSDETLPAELDFYKD